MFIFSKHCRPYLPKTAGQDQTTRSQIYPFLLIFQETHASCPSVQILHQPNTLFLASDSP